MANDSNDTDHLEKLRTEFIDTQAAPLAIIYVVGLISNTIVIVNGIRRRKLIMHYSNYFVLSMAFADWCVIFFTVPLMFVENLYGYFDMSPFACGYLIQIRESFQGAAVFSISMLAILRVRQVTHDSLQPIRRRTCRILVVGIWLLSFLLCTVPLLGIFTVHPNTGYCDPDWPTDLRLQVQMTFICIILGSPIIVGTISYAIVIFKISNVADRETSKNRSITVMLIMLISSCWVSYTPMIVFLSLNSHTNIEPSNMVWHICTIMFIGGSALNPVLVLITMPKDYRFNVHCERKRRVTAEPMTVEQKHVSQTITVADKFESNTETSF